MKILDILKTVGAGLISTHPAGAAALTLVNQFLPEDKKLPETATGEQVQNEIDQLPPEVKHTVMLANIDLEKVKEEGYTKRYEAMCKADGQQTRAAIVKQAMNFLCWITLLFMCAIAYVYVTEGAEAAFSEHMVWLFLAVTGTYAYVVRAYFGDLKSETQSRHTIMDSKPRTAAGITSILQSIKGR